MHECIASDGGHNEKDVAHVFCFAGEKTFNMPLVLQRNWKVCCTCRMRLLFVDELILDKSFVVIIRNYSTMISFPTFCNLPIIFDGIVKCPLGQLQLKTCAMGVHRLDFCTKVDGQLDVAKPIDILAMDEKKLDAFPKPAAQAIDWMKNYFEAPAQLASVPTPSFCFIPSMDQENRFADRVLIELSNVKFGETVSYAELAKRAGNAKASRAVGQTMRSNPVSLIIPCHRVVLSSGGMGHYGGGKADDLKAWLLKYEAENAGCS